MSTLTDAPVGSVPFQENGTSALETVAGVPEGQSMPEALSAPPAGTVVCTKCGVENPAGADACMCGAFLPANQAARRSGIYARTQPADLRLTADDLRERIITDRGGPSEISTLEMSYIQKLTDIDVTLRLMTHDIAINGLLTPGGRVRNVYDKLLAGLATFDRFAQRIGVERRSKPVRSLAEVMNDHDL